GAGLPEQALERLGTALFLEVAGRVAAVTVVPDGVKVSVEMLDRDHVAIGVGRIGLVLVKVVLLDFRIVEGVTLRRRRSRGEGGSKRRRHQGKREKGGGERAW